MYKAKKTVFYPSPIVSMGPFSKQSSRKEHKFHELLIHSLCTQYSRRAFPVNYFIPVSVCRCQDFLFHTFVEYQQVLHSNGKVISSVLILKHNRSPQHIIFFIESERNFT